MQTPYGVAWAKSSSSSSSQGILGLPVLEGKNSPTHTVPAASLGLWPHSGPNPARQAPGELGHGPLPVLKEHGGPAPRPSLVHTTLYLASGAVSSLPFPPGQAGP